MRNCVKILVLIMAFWGDYWGSARSSMLLWEKLAGIVVGAFSVS